MVIVMEVQIDKLVYEVSEVLGRQNLDFKVYFWNLGCLFYEMFVLELAFYDRSGVNSFFVFMDIMQGNFLVVLVFVSQLLIDLVNRCFVSDFVNRLSLQEIEDVIIQYNFINLQMVELLD